LDNELLGDHKRWARNRLRAAIGHPASLVLQPQLL
jgi:hypothetical protein